MYKKDRLIEIASQIQELYPDLDRVLINDEGGDEPVSIVITSQERLNDIAIANGLDPDLLEEVTDDMEDYLDGIAGYLGFEDDDDDDGTRH